MAADLQKGLLDMQQRTSLIKWCAICSTFASTAGTLFAAFVTVARVPVQEFQGVATHDTTFLLASGVATLASGILSAQAKSESSGSQSTYDAMPRRDSPAHSFLHRFLLLAAGTENNKLDQGVHDLLKITSIQANQTLLSAKEYHQAFLGLRDFLLDIHDMLLGGRGGVAAVQEKFRRMGVAFGQLRKEVSLYMQVARQCSWCSVGG